MTADQEWREKTYTYVNNVNEFVERGLRLGWDKAGAEPVDRDRSHLAEMALAAVRAANASGDLDQLRELWPPAHNPLIACLATGGQSIPALALLGDGTIIVRVGETYSANASTVRISGDDATVLGEVGFFGVGPNGRYFAVAEAGSVRLTDGWDGPTSAVCPWPTGQEGVPAGSAAKAISRPLSIESLVPFPDGKRVLLIGSDGVFVMSVHAAHRLLPSERGIAEHIQWHQEENADEQLSLGIDMAHGAVSGDGQWIAVGSQDGPHLVFDAELALAAEVGHASEYPHYALFSEDDRTIALNSCHFYSGTTIAVPVGLLPGLTTEAYSDDSRTPVVEDGSRFYAGVARNDEFILGDASGYVRAFSTDGEPRWQFFVGSTVSAMALSPDGKTLVVSTYAGYVSIIELDAGKQAPHQIGNSQHREVRRWLFWKNEPAPLIW